MTFAVSGSAGSGRAVRVIGIPAGSPLASAVNVCSKLLDSLTLNSRYRYYFPAAFVLVICTAMYFGVDPLPPSLMVFDAIGV